jgi:hypothetical protein
MLEKLHITGLLSQRDFGLIDVGEITYYRFVVTAFLDQRKK